MAPAEIWQGGKLVNLIKGLNTHTGKIDGVEIQVEDGGNAPGCKFIRFDGKPITKGYLSIGDSKTLDGGEIVKSVK